MHPIRNLYCQFDTMRVVQLLSLLSNQFISYIMWWDYTIFMNSNYNPAWLLQSTKGLVVEGSPVAGPFGGHYIYRSKFEL